MQFRGELDRIDIDYITHRPIISFKLKTLDEAENVEKLKDKDLDIEAKQHREKRSLNANAYCWLLIGKLADVLKTGKDEMYLTMLKRYGQSELVSVKSSIDVKGYFKYYEVAGTSILNEKEFTHYKVFKGSSEYDTREMSILIDGIVSEAKEQGIQTLTPDELAKIKALWTNEVANENEKK